MKHFTLFSENRKALENLFSTREPKSNPDTQEREDPGDGPACGSRAGEGRQYEPSDTAPAAMLKTLSFQERILMAGILLNGCLKLRYLLIISEVSRGRYDPSGTRRRAARRL
jgi:hypothetical protein